MGIEIDHAVRDEYLRSFAGRQLIEVSAGAGQGTAASILTCLLRACGGLGFRPGRQHRIVEEPFVRRLDLPRELRSVCQLTFDFLRCSEEWWPHLHRLNEHFADAVLSEIGGGPAIVLIGDYRFGLLPRLLKLRNPGLPIGFAADEPWPASPSTRFAPWLSDLVAGILGADLVWCESDASRSHFELAASDTISRGLGDDPGRIAYNGHTTVLQTFPATRRRGLAASEVEHFIRRLREEIGDVPEILGVSMYTAADIPARLDAIDSLLRSCPELVGRITVAQCGPPQPGRIESYVLEKLDTLNRRWAVRHWRPIAALERPLSADERTGLFLTADFCLAGPSEPETELAFVTSRIDEDGVLILLTSQDHHTSFPDALSARADRPSEIAFAIAAAVGMHADERRSRMLRMRRPAQEQEVTRLAAQFLQSLRSAAPESARSPSIPA